jgi:hypothetical protein
MGHSKSKIQHPNRDQASEFRSDNPQHTHHVPERSCRVKQTFYKAIETIGGPQGLCKPRLHKLPNKESAHVPPAMSPDVLQHGHRGDNMQEAVVIDLVSDSEDEIQIHGGSSISLCGDLESAEDEHVGNSPIPNHQISPARMHGEAHNSPNLQHGQLLEDNLFLGDYDAAFAELVAAGYDDDMNFAQANANNFQPAVEMGLAGRLPASPLQRQESQEDVVNGVLLLFPDICGAHVAELFSTISKSTGRIIEHILDQIEKGSEYPKAKEKTKDLKSLKRKRAIEEDEEAINKYGSIDRPLPGFNYARTA